MKVLDSFHDRNLVDSLAGRIAAAVKRLGKPVSFMEVCGTHTSAIHGYGLKSLLPPEVRLVSGPGCPVCVTPNGFVDRVVALSRLPEVIIATFGDMVRVPGSSSSLVQERAKGGEVRIVYSPLDAVALAEKNPQRKVVFLGVGFETTAPAVAASILTAKARALDNYFVLAAHKTMPQAMELLSRDPELPLDGYLCPPHVSAIIGAKSFSPIAESHRIPCVVTGFEPVDILQGVEMLLRQLVHGESRVEIQYSRVVTWEGNARARSVLDEVFSPCDAEWRGLGMVPGSGLRIGERYLPFDAQHALPVEVEEAREQKGCRCGEVLKGKIHPEQCELFGRGCRPEAPVGACMVSSEGSCAAAYRYR